MDVVDRFFAKFPTRSYLKGEVILQLGEAPTVAHAIRQGIVKVYNIDNNGIERPIGFEVKNELFPIAWISGFIDKTSYFYESFTDTTIAHIPRQELIHAMKHDNELIFAMHERYVRRLADLQMRIESLEQPRAAQKIVYSLKFLCSRFGQERGGNKMDITIPLTQQDIANFLGLTRETTAIELKKLEKTGLLTYNHQHYVINTQKLNDILDDM